MGYGGISPHHSSSGAILMRNYSGFLQNRKKNNRDPNPDQKPFRKYR
jgi:hypothetical protein